LLGIVKIYGFLGEAAGLAGDIAGLVGDIAGLVGDIAGLTGDAAGLVGDSGAVVSVPPPQALKGNKSADAASKASVLVFMVFHQCNDGYRLCSLPVVSVNPLLFNSLLFSICRNYISFSKPLGIIWNIKT
jgi:hypothetical protein